MARTGKEQYVMGALPLLANALVAFGDGVVEGLSYRQFYLLSMIQRMGGADKSVARIAEFCGSTRQNIRRMLDALADKGLVELAPSPFDGRALSVKLTRRGRSLIERQAAQVNGRVAELLEPLSDAELDALVADLGRLAACIDAAAE